MVIGGQGGLRPPRPKACNAGKNDGWIFPADLIVGQSNVGHHTRPIIADDNIRLFTELTRNRQITLGFQVKGNGPLPTIEILKECGEARLL